MKRTGFDIWGSDIQFMIPTSSVDYMKCLLLLDINGLSPAHIPDKTKISSPSLHQNGEKIKKDTRSSCFLLTTKKETTLFHIIEQDRAKSTAYVHKKGAGYRITAG